MWILHDNVIEREDDDENFEKNSFFFIMISYFEIDLFEIKV